MKTIHFSGNDGQRCQASYSIGADKREQPGFFVRTSILFIADENCPGMTSPNTGDLPNQLLNRVLELELPGCRLDFIDVFLAERPDERGRRTVRRWHFESDLSNPKGEDVSRLEVPIYATALDRVKAFLHISSAKEDLLVATISVNERVGIYPVLVKTEKPALREVDRLELLNRFNVLSR